MAMLKHIAANMVTAIYIFTLDSLHMPWSSAPKIPKGTLIYLGSV